MPKEPAQRIKVKVKGKTYLTASISGEEAVISLAIDLEQKGDHQSMALARAMRGMMVPIQAHLNSEHERWSSNSDVSDTCYALVKTMSAAMAAFVASVDADNDGLAKILLDSFASMFQEALEVTAEVNRTDPEPK